MSNILFTSEELQNCDPHPMQFAQQRTQYLDHLMNMSSQAVPLRNQIPTLSLYTQNYQNLQEKLKQIKVEEMKYLKPHLYETLFDNDDEKEQKLNEQRSQYYYNEYVEKPRLIQERELMEQKKKENQQTALYGVVDKQRKQNPAIKEDIEVHKREMNNLREELMMIGHQAEQERQRANPTPECMNNDILSKVSGSLLNFYKVYFNEIFDSLIDDILLDEVQHLQGYEDQQINVNDYEDKYNQYNQYDQGDSTPIKKEVNDNQDYEDVNINDQLQDIIQKLGNLVDYD